MPGTLSNLQQQLLLDSNGGPTIRGGLRYSTKSAGPLDMEVPLIAAPLSSPLTVPERSLTPVETVEMLRLDVGRVQRSPRALEVTRMVGPPSGTAANLWSTCALRPKAGGQGGILEGERPCSDTTRLKTLARRKPCASWRSLPRCWSASERCCWRAS